MWTAQNENEEGIPLYTAHSIMQILMCNFNNPKQICFMQSFELFQFSARPTQGHWQTVLERWAGVSKTLISRPSLGSWHYVPVCVHAGGTQTTAERVITPYVFFIYIYLKRKGPYGH